MLRTRMWVNLTLFILTLFLFTPNLHGQVTVRQQLFVMKEVVPSAKKVGILWNKVAGESNFIEKLKRAAAPMGVEVYVVEVTSLKEVSKGFKDLVDGYGVQAIWVATSDDILNNSSSRKYLIKNSTLKQIPLFSPASEWIADGACVYVGKTDGKIKLWVNEKTAKVVQMQIPEKYKASVELLAKN